MGIQSDVYRSFFDRSIEGMFLTTPAGRYILVNSRLAEIYGFSSSEEMMDHFQNIKTQLYVDPSRRDDFVKAMNEAGTVLEFESQVRRKDGTIIWISENARQVRDEHGQIVHYEGTVVDITDRKLLAGTMARQQAFYHQLFHNSPLAMILLDAERSVISCNSAFERLFGYNASEIRSSSIRDKIIPDELILEAENYRAAILTGSSHTKETIRRHKDGRDIPVNMQGFPVMLEGSVAGIYYLYEDITERKAYEETIMRQAFHDSLTGLPNRHLFNDRLNRAVERSKRRESYHFAVVLMDLDRFKKVNDTLGHLVGDRLLVHVGKILHSCLRTVDTAARLGGDEFALIEEFRSRQDVLLVLDRIHALLHEPFDVGERTLQTSGSMGIVINTSEYSSAEELMRDADIAMYRAKEHRKPYQFFSREMQRELMEIMEIETDLKNAIAGQQLFLYYQPIVSLARKRLEGFEALLRWMHPSRGMMQPDHFIPIAEDTGMILPIGSWVIQEACRQLRVWTDANRLWDDLTISINVSIRQFTHIDLPGEIERSLSLYEIDPGRLRLEITESTLIQDMDEILAVLRELKRLGVKLAIDDFGTGYSSLSYLRELPVDTLKIDRSFISGENRSPDSFQIVKLVTSMARSLGMTVVAEGVEEVYQQDILRDLQCDNAQGFLYSRPLKGDGVAEWILENGFLEQR
ncbi:MAG TPA: EAL domain-containing protein [Leptospiraceae bacterium]|nr:EAL domain-containing protein [Leptospirales bacterium]HMU83834.1 EAL domain-containing protein [Leptospiraceae bacterium]HMW58433.1 EAL domain-containing protein [Leptospiraceae bacterium]HMX55289.1 EAL domain-containing protein [Leptospiraceae bacterium]HMZ36552.1 EAL domain-containing protein [Leptospiraceae bacterium]